MLYNYNTNLTNYQRLNRSLYAPPSNSLSSLGYERIHHYESHKILKYHTIYSNVMTRIYAFAIPFFALLDTIRFVGEILFRAVILDRAGLQFALLNCAKALKLFALSIPAWIPSVFNPDLVFRSETRWKEIQKEQTIKKMEITLKSLAAQRELKEGFQEILQEEINEYVISPDIRGIFTDCLRELVNSLPQDPEKMQIVVSHYFNLAATFLVQAANDSISFEEKKCFLEIFTELVQIRDPEFREKLLTHVLASERKWKALTQPIDSSSTASGLFTLLARQLTSDEEILKNLCKLSKSAYFNNLVNKRSFLAMLLNIQNKQLNDEEKTLLLKQIAVLATASSEENAKKLSPKKIQSILDRKIKERNSKQDKYDKALETLGTKEPGSKEYNSANNQAKQSKVNLEKVEAEILELEALKAALALDGKPAPVISKGMQNLSILLSLPSSEMLMGIVSKIGKEKTEDPGYFHISDREIVEDLYKSVMGLEESVVINFDKLAKFRAPDALLKFHLRLMEYTGSDREVILQKNREIFLSILDGTFYQKRFDEELNPHLKTVFSGRDDLKRIWCQDHAAKKVDALIPNPSKVYKDHEISIAKDPTDILLIGNDLGTCVNLDGRLNRVMGVLGFLADGKTHTLVAKSTGDSASVAETQLQLLWDKQNNRPVLFFEQVNYTGSTKNDHTLESAMIAYARELADSMGITMVSCYNNHDSSIPFLQEVYQGSVESLGSSSPIEYVNSQYTNTNGVYSIGKCWEVVSHASAEQLYACGQWPKCNGSTNKELAMEVVGDLQKKPVKNVRFNPVKVTGYVDGGNCTSLAFDFGAKALELYNADLSMEEIAKRIRTWEATYQSGEAGNLMKIRSVQEAFNTIEVDKSPSADLSKKKIKAMARYYGLKITDASPEFKTLLDTQDKAIRIMKDLRNGVHFLRIIKPLDNDKQEEFGHSLILIKKGDEALFYDPSDTVEHIKSKYLGDRIFHHLHRCLKRWDVQDARFYKLA